MSIDEYYNHTYSDIALKISAESDRQARAYSVARLNTYLLLRPHLKNQNIKPEDLYKLSSDKSEEAHTMTMEQADEIFKQWDKIDSQ